MVLGVNLELMSIENWAIWFEGKPYAKNNINDAQPIPSDMKRRCSLLSKIALETANRAMGKSKIDYAIFCTQHGELECATDLLKDICKKEILSPAKFSQSVHNTVAGLFSIMHHLHIDTISIAARHNTFFMGMLEAYTWLKLNPGKTILLVMFDGAIPKIYNSLNAINNNDYAVALLLTDQLTKPPFISLDLSANLRHISHEGNHLALEFLQWYIGFYAKELMQTTDDYIAKWCKADG